MDLIKAIEAEQEKENLEQFGIGDNVRVHFMIVEGNTQRIQVFEGLCIAINNSGLRKTFTIRKISYGVGVERIFPFHSPKIKKIEVVRYGKVRRSKLYYIRGRVGKSAKVKELLNKKQTKKAAAAK